MPPHLAWFAGKRALCLAASRPFVWFVEDVEIEASVSETHRVSSRYVISGGYRVIGFMLCIGFQ